VSSAEHFKTESPSKSFEGPSHEASALSLEQIPLPLNKKITCLCNRPDWFGTDFGISKPMELGDSISIWNKLCAPEGLSSDFQKS